MIGSPERLCGWWQSARGCDGVCVAGAVRVLPGFLRDEDAFRDPQGKTPLLPDGHKSRKHIIRYHEVQWSQLLSIKNL